MAVSTQGEQDCETANIYNSIRKWGFGLLFSLLMVLTLLDVADSIWMGNVYDGPPAWLTGIVGGVFAALFGARLIEAVKK